MVMMASDASPQWGGGWKTSCMAICGVYMPYVHNPESQECTDGFTDLTGNGCLGKPTIDMLDLSMMEKNGCGFKGQRVGYQIVQQSFICMEYSKNIIHGYFPCYNSTT